MISDAAGAISVSGTDTYATAGRDVATVSLSDDGAGGTTTAYSVANVGGAAGGLHINLIWDPSVSSAPPEFEAAVSYAAQFLEQLITDPVTVNIDVGWGEAAGEAIDPATAAGETLREPSARMFLIRN